MKRGGWFECTDASGASGHSAVPDLIRARSKFEALLTPCINTNGPWSREDNAGAPSEVLVLNIEIAQILLSVSP